jgi:predicted enzyme related to lactoylglutathione lyase
MNNRVVHFEIHCPDIQASRKFFETVLGWKCTRYEGPQEYWLVSTGDPSSRGIDGGLMPSRDGQPRTVNTVSVENLDNSVKAAIAAGGKNVVPRMAIPGVGWLAYCTDPGGNIFGMMQPDANAK